MLRTASFFKKRETSDNEDKAVAFGGWKQFDLFNFEEQKLILLRRNQNTFSVEKRNHFNYIAKINQAEGKLDPATKKNSGQGDRGRRLKGGRNAKQQILFFKKTREERESKKWRGGGERNPKSSLCNLPPRYAFAFECLNQSYIKIRHSSKIGWPKIQFKQEYFSGKKYTTLKTVLDSIKDT